MTSIEKTVCYSSQEEGTRHTMQGHTGKHQGQSGAMSGEKAWAGISSVVSMKKARQGRVSQIRIG